ncbi:uncharacterized protein LOC134772819 [Penaeus indicus]|uniref:uncharacterized protein LOC134772819 n=1 Tax=Penaeus indicus TaxID=29960 RepID=UPI00300D47D3
MADLFTSVVILEWWLHVMKIRIMMTWTTVGVMLVLPLVIQGCEVTTLGSHLEEPLKKNGDSWTVNVDMNPNHDDDWQLGLLLTVSDEVRATTVINLTLNHISNPVLRLHGHFGEGEISGDGILPMPKKQSFPLAVTVRRYDLELQVDHVKKVETHRVGNFDGITTSTLELKNIVAAENFNVSHGCVEVNNSTATTLKYSAQPKDKLPFVFPASASECFSEVTHLQHTGSVRGAVGKSGHRKEWGNDDLDDCCDGDRAADGDTR